MFGLCVLYQQHEEKSFLSWMRETNQLFTGDEYQTRFGVWMANKRLVQEHNAGKKSFKIAVNKLSALTPAEYKAMLGFKPVAKSSRAVASKAAPVDASLDWRDKGVVNSIKDQASCGSCWAFSTIQAAESNYAIKTGTLPRWSEQNLVDCDTTSSGCNGGLMTSALDYVMDSQNGNFMDEDDYSYTGTDGTCK